MYYELKVGDNLLPVKKALYRKAYKELYEVIKQLSKNEIEKLPNDFIMKIHENMDTDYEFIYDESVGILEQNFMVETKALIIEMYRRFLVEDSQNEYWKEYDKKCFNAIEEEKRAKYDPNKLFENPNNKETQDIQEEKIETSLVKVEENFFKRILNKLAKILKK